MNIMRTAFYLFFILFFAASGQGQTLSSLINSTSTVSTASSIGRSTALDINGNKYITGEFSGSVTFGSTTLTSIGGTDIFLAKYDASGTFQWAKRAGGTSTDKSYGIALSGTSVYITGTFWGTANFNTPSATGSNEIISGGLEDIFIAKYDASGTFQWAKRAGSTNSDSSNGISVSGTSVYITGSFSGAANFNTPSTTGSNQIVSFNSLTDIFLAKYDDTGTFQWAKRAGGSSLDISHAVAASGTSVYITGQFQNVANFNNPSAVGSNEIDATGAGRDIFLAKYDDTGTFQWAKRAGGGSPEYGYGIAVSDTALYITGSFGGTINFNNPSTAGTNEITSIGLEDIYIAQYNKMGTFRWAKRAGGTGTEISYGVAVSDTSIYIAGYFNGTANFNSPSAIGSNEISSAGTSDIFLAKYGASGTFQWAKRAGGTLSDISYGIAVSGTSICITGYFRGSANFNSPYAPGSNDLTTISTSGDTFVASYYNTALPIELISFQGEKRGSYHFLTWETSNQILFSHFEIEKADENGVFRKIATVTPKTDIANTYTFENKDFITNKNYYRLKMVNEDNSFDYSKIIVLNDLQNTSSSVLIYPNPTSEIINLQIDNNIDENAIILLLDLQGKILQTTTQTLNKGQNTFEISLKETPSGIYFIRYQGEHRNWISKVIKE
jgi:Secretion system C-terminal sorting domain